MAFSVTPHHEDFFAEVNGVDLSQALDDVAAEEARAAEDGYALHAGPPATPVKHVVMMQAARVLHSPGASRTVKAGPYIAISCARCQ